VYLGSPCLSVLGPLCRYPLYLQSLQPPLSGLENLIHTGSGSLEACTPVGATCWGASCSNWLCIGKAELKATIFQAADLMLASAAPLREQEIVPSIEKPGP
jgi:hypothetical protein